MNNKRGQLSMEMIVGIIILLVVLVLVAASFTTGFQGLIKKLSGIGSAIPEADRLAAKASCDQYCSAASKDVYCNPSFAGTLEGKKCNDFTSCSTISC